MRSWNSAKLRFENLSGSPWLEICTMSLLTN